MCQDDLYVEPKSSTYSSWLVNCLCKHINFNPIFCCGENAQIKDYQIAVGNLQRKCLLFSAILLIFVSMSGTIIINKICLPSQDISIKTQCVDKLLSDTIKTFYWELLFIEGGRDCKTTIEEMSCLLNVDGLKFNSHPNVTCWGWSNLIFLAFDWPILTLLGSYLSLLLNHSHFSWVVSDHKVNYPLFFNFYNYIFLTFFTSQMFTNYSYQPKVFNNATTSDVI